MLDAARGSSKADTLFLSAVACCAHKVTVVAGQALHSGMDSSILSMGLAQLLQGCCAAMCQANATG